MLSQSFAEVWVAGDVGEAEVEALRKALLECARRGWRRIRFRFYRSSPGLEYMEAFRQVLVENVSMSIVAEEHPLEALPVHAEVIGEALLVVGRGAESVLEEALKRGGAKLRVLGGVGSGR